MNDKQEKSAASDWATLSRETSEAVGIVEERMAQSHWWADVLGSESIGDHRNTQSESAWVFDDSESAD